MRAADRAELKRLLDRYGVLEVARAFGQLAAVVPPTDKKGRKAGPRCSICAAHQSEVADRMVGGWGGFICIRCIDLCQAIKEEKWTARE